MKVGVFMKSLKFYTLLFSMAIHLIEQKNFPLITADTLCFEIDENSNFDEISLENPSILYPEIEKLIFEDSWSKMMKISHQNNQIYDRKNDFIFWDVAFQKIKENNKSYLMEHSDLSYLEEYPDEELKNIFSTIKRFIIMMDNEYEICMEDVACKLNHLEILKDSREAVLEVPYFAIYEGSTQTLNFLEDSDLDYFEITIAEETFHFLQGSCPDYPFLRQSVWKEPIEYAVEGIPSPLRTIILDEYLAKIQAQKMHAEYIVDHPDFSFLYFLELALLPNENYIFQDTLTTLSIHQNSDGFYKLFGAVDKNDKIMVHKIMHTLDIEFGYFSEEVNNKSFFDGSITKNELLEISKVFFKNVEHRKNNYDLNTLFYLMNLMKSYSIYIFDNTYLESDVSVQKDLFIKEYEKLEKGFLERLELKYHDSLLSSIYQNYDSNIDSVYLDQQNIDFVRSLQEEMKEFYDYETQKKITASFKQ